MKLPLLTLFVSAVAFSGCTTTVHYNAKYLDQSFRNVKPSIQGKALIVTEEKNDYRHYSQSPSSISGAALKVVGNYGQHLNEIAESFFKRLFTEGADHSHEVTTGNDYRVIIKPEIVRFDYRYNALRNLGFAITPESKFDLYVAIYDANDVLAFEKKYVNSYVSGGTYLISFKPQEKINKSVHKALFQLMIEVSEDIEDYCESEQSVN